jgi:L-alanine-DL-glutamate epimerase-like enolase superfamily enzyme
VCGDTPLAFFEQPVPVGELDGIGRVAKATGTPIGADEGLHSMDDFRRHHEVGIDGGSLKTIKLGGMQAVIEAGQVCARLGMKVNLACKMAETGIASSAMTHIAAAIPTLDWGVSLTHTYLTEDLIKRPLDLSGGHVALTAGPGIGLEVDEAKVRRYFLEV